MRDTGIVESHSVLIRETRDVGAVDSAVVSLVDPFVLHHYHNDMRGRSHN